MSVAVPELCHLRVFLGKFPTASAERVWGYRNNGHRKLGRDRARIADNDRDDNQSHAPEVPERWRQLPIFLIDDREHGHENR
jgi:hypothetical protein